MMPKAVRIPIWLVFNRLLGCIGSLAREFAVLGGETAAFAVALRFLA